MFHLNRCRDFMEKELKDFFGNGTKEKNMLSLFWGVGKIYNINHFFSNLHHFSNVGKFQLFCFAMFSIRLISFSRATVVGVLINFMTYSICICEKGRMPGKIWVSFSQWI